MRRSATSSPDQDGGLGLGTTTTSVIFLSTILAVVVYLAVTKRDVIRTRPAESVLVGDLKSPVLVVLNKVEATPSLLDAVRRRVAEGVTDFFVLVPQSRPPRL